METLETNYIAAAIDALNKVITSDVSPRLASKVVRFRAMLSEYAKTHNGGNQRALDFETNAENSGAKDADGNEITDIYTV